MNEPIHRTNENDLWQPIDTADTSNLFANSTWVLIATDEPRVTEAIPHYFTGGDGYIWMTSRGPNVRGSENEWSQMLNIRATHWMPLPEHPLTALRVTEDSK